SILDNKVRICIVCQAFINSDLGFQASPEHAMIKGGIHDQTIRRTRFDRQVFE
ncbi:hypothetical protein SK128_006008, partial [Halocaridina rubra]